MLVEVLTQFLFLRSFKADSKLKKATCAFIASQLLTKEEKDKIDTIFRTMDITRDGKLSKAEVKAGFYKVSGQFLSDQEIDEMFARVDCDGTFLVLVKYVFFVLLPCFYSLMVTSCVFLGNIGTGEIEYSEFVIASMSETDLLSKDRLKKAFQLFDKDNSGSITISELREIFSFFQTAGSDIDEAVSLHHVLTFLLCTPMYTIEHAVLTPISNVNYLQYIDKVIAQIDADGDGDVSFDEFCEMMINGVPV
jgi:Ca2+-binding EF-hand superfamily protein